MLKKPLSIWWNSIVNKGNNIELKVRRAINEIAVSKNKRACWWWPLFNSITDIINVFFANRWQMKSDNCYTFSSFEWWWQTLLCILEAGSN